MKNQDWLGLKSGLNSVLCNLLHVLHPGEKNFSANNEKG
jgi:hypothetical protein